MEFPFLNSIVFPEFHSLYEPWSLPFQCFIFDVPARFRHVWPKSRSSKLWILPGQRGYLKWIQAVGMGLTHLIRMRHPLAHQH